MDTSETYIKMCDCEEIQDKRPWNSVADMDFPSSIYYGWKEDDSYHIENNRRLIEQPYYEGLFQAIWLPRQDQLQEMSQFSGGLPNQLWNFNEFCFPDRWNFDEYTSGFTSMEQLWLAFVMKEKYGKVWTGKWVTEKVMVG